MPEEKKQEGFTFSDKIKSGKKTAPKSFASRFSSKIGRDGKPRQTLFERTKRDAPFFIAAVVALLLLPFLYKYSGQVNEDTSIVTPSYEDAILNPDRSGFDFTGDADGQISQLSGRDSMDLIVGLGQKKAEESADESLDELYRSGLSDDAAASSYARDDMDEEINNTNIYRYRKNAPKQTRAAFRRAATKLGRLGPAGLSGRGGGANIQPWGGKLKDAAQKVGAEKPRTAPKPVSLQPLTAARRTSFGQGPAAEARRSKDAMSKHNPLQALMDAQMRPVEPHGIGGIGGGLGGGPGGGNGNLQRQFTFNGKEPWWWDLMKTRSQMEWERWFNYKWGWIDWATQLVQNWLGGILNCLVMGDSGGDPDNFLGSSDGGGKKECCGWDEKKWQNHVDLKDLPFDEAHCKSMYMTVARAQGKDRCEFKWKDTTVSAGGRLSGWQQRKACLGGAVGAPGVSNATDCEQFSTLHHYSVYPTGRARKWKHQFHYIVARNYVPQSLIQFIKNNGGVVKGEDLLLCDSNRDYLEFNGRNSAGVGITATMDQAQLDEYNKLVAKYDDCVSKYHQKGGTCSKEARAVKDYENQIRTMARDTRLKSRDRLEQNYVDPELLDDSCVIYVGKGTVLDWNQRFRPQVEEMLEALIRKRVPSAVDSFKITQAAKEAFDQLDLLMIGSMISKDKLGTGGWFSFNEGDRLRKLPMPYWRFYEAYLIRKGTNTNEKGSYHSRIDKRKYRTEGEDVVYGATCLFDSSVRISCDYNDENWSAKVIVNGSYKGGKTEDIEFNKDLTVTAVYTALDGSSGRYNEQHFSLEPQKGEGEYVFEFTHPVTGDGKDAEKKPGRITWTLYRGGQAVSTAVCDVNNAADKPSPGVEPKPDEDPVPPPTGDDKEARLATYLPWVPRKPDCRDPVTGAPKASDFCPDKKLNTVPGDQNKCGREVLLVMDSTAAKTFVQQVVDAYNATNPEVKLSSALISERGFPTDGEFVDALVIASQTDGAPKTVPASAVCELGRDMVRMSLDKHTKENVKVKFPLASPYETDKSRPVKDDYFHNELGAFLAYIHGESILYPQKMYVTENNCDYRFSVVPEAHPCQSGQAWTSPSAAERRFHHNNYNQVSSKVYPTYFASLTPLQQEFPLHALVQGRSIASYTTCDGKNGSKGCYKEGGQYVRDIALLVHEDSGFTAWQGKACTAFYGGGDGPAVQVEDVLKYVYGACEAGLDYKPHGLRGAAGGTRPTGGGNNTDPSTRN